MTERLFQKWTVKPKAKIRGQMEYIFNIFSTFSDQRPCFMDAKEKCFIYLFYDLFLQKKNLKRRCGRQMLLHVLTCVFDINSINSFLPPLQTKER